MTTDQERYAIQLFIGKQRLERAGIKNWVKLYAIEVGADLLFCVTFYTADTGFFSAFNLGLSDELVEQLLSAGFKEHSRVHEEHGRTTIRLLYA